MTAYSTHLAGRLRAAHAAAEAAQERLADAHAQLLRLEREHEETGSAWVSEDLRKARHTADVATVAVLRTAHRLSELEALKASPTLDGLA